MTKIVHISDWHGQFSHVPEADLYLVTGDMLANYPKQLSRADVGMPKSYAGERIIWSREEKNQAGWVAKQNRKGGLRRFLGSPDAPVCLVRGNHCFTDLGPGFGGEYFEVTWDGSRTVTYCDLKIGGFRGVRGFCGTWSDELTDAELDQVVEKLPHDLDVVISHTPPAGILDQVGPHPTGSSALSEYIDRCLEQDSEKRRVFCFGHIHECGPRTLEWDNGWIFSNAATGVNVINLS